MYIRFSYVSLHFLSMYIYIVHTWSYPIYVHMWPLFGHAYIYIFFGTKWSICFVFKYDRTSVYCLKVSVNRFVESNWLHDRISSMFLLLLLNSDCSTLSHEAINIQSGSFKDHRGHLNIFSNCEKNIFHQYENDQSFFKRI